jgi:hypothetical protein
MSMIDGVFAHAAQNQVAMYNRIAEYEEARALNDLLTARQALENVGLVKRQFDQQLRPAVILRPLLTLEGNEWVASYGDLQARGPMPDLAYTAFDSAWVGKQEL